jgi:hypothetical protein
MGLSYLVSGAAVLWASVMAVTNVVSGVQAYEAWSAQGGAGYDDPGYDEAHSLLDLSVAIGGAGVIAVILLSVSLWRSYGRARQRLGPEPERVTIRELEDVA